METVACADSLDGLRRDRALEAGIARLMLPGTALGASVGPRKLVFDLLEY